MLPQPPPPLTQVDMMLGRCRRALQLNLEFLQQMKRESRIDSPNPGIASILIS
jgi:hypothetical protein